MVAKRSEKSAVASETNASLRFSTKALLVVVLGVWIALAVWAGTSGILTAGPDTLVRPVLLSVVVPIAIFLAVYASSRSFRNFVLSRDIRVATTLQAWRIIGFAFLMLYAHGVLPGLFAWPAGLGDVAMGLSAPLVLLALARRTDFVRSRRFVVWNLLGILDFLVAAATATLASGAIPELVAGPVTSAPMEIWPLSLFPSFIVPLFFFMHLSVLLQVRRLRLDAIRAGQQGAGHGGTK